MKIPGKSLSYYAIAIPSRGFTLIELMIVIAIIAIILSLALPVYTNYSIRAKITEGLSVANSAVTAVSAACVEVPNLASLTNAQAGYSFNTGGDLKDYVESVEVSGPCTAPVITITTKNIGQVPDPVLLMTGELLPNSGKIEWQCSSTNTPNWLLPGSCRS